MVIPTPEPASDPITLGEVFDATCQVANAIDPLLPEPATAGVDAGISEIIDMAAESANASPNPTPFYMLLRGGINLLKGAKDTLATGYNFLCQQVKQEGPYYEFLPIKDQWAKMTLPQKVTTGLFIIAITVTAVAFILAPP